MNAIKYLLFNLGLLGLLAACTPGDTMQHAQRNLVTEEQSLGSHALTGAAEAVREFLQWYSVHLDSLEKSLWLKPAGNAASDSLPLYVFDKAAARDYLKKLRDSGLVSGQYTDDWRQIFNALGNDSLVQIPDNMFPLGQQGVDLVMLSKDYQQDLAQLSQAEVVHQQIQKNRALIMIRFVSGHALSYWLTGTNGQWMIDEIHGALPEHKPQATGR